MQCRLAIFIVLCLSLCGCHVIRPLSFKRPDRGTAGLPNEFPYDFGRLHVRSNFVIPDSDRLGRELTAEGDAVCKTLGLPCSQQPITVYLFKDARSYGECLSRDFPNVPSRRAFFLESNGELAVYAHWSDRVAEDLRHEVAHGYLHAVVSGLPLWLDEGLAEYFEVSQGQGGLNPPHLVLLAELEQNGWRPDLERLERLDDISQMDQQSYAEAWAWVYFMLNSHPERREVLVQYLANLSSPRGPAEPLSVALKKFDLTPERELVAFLDEPKKNR